MAVPGINYVAAPAGLPWLQMGAASVSDGIQSPLSPIPAKADIVQDSKGGGAESGPYDGGSNADSA